MSNTNMVEGTGITKARFSQMLAHSAKLNEDCAPSPGQETQPSIAGFPLAAAVSNVTGGDYEPDQVPPIGELPGDGDTKDKQTEPPQEAIDRDIALLFSESDKDDEEKDGDEDEKDGEVSDDDKVYKDGDEQEECSEAVALHCSKCGYEDEYSLNEEDLAMDPPPMKDGKLDQTCPMCGSDMDMSLVGATDQDAVGDPNPFTGPRGEGGTDPVGESALSFARDLISQVLEGEEPSTLARSVIEADFMPTV